MEEQYGLQSAGECDTIIREYCKGSRPNAKKSLKTIAKQQGTALPSRYLARLIYHEAAGSISPGSISQQASSKRIQLLQEAYEHAVEATSLAPNSLSCAALRATLAINLLVEESALLNPSSSTHTSKPGKKGQAGMSTLDRKCQELRERFRGSIDACRTALEHPSPVMVEPVITMITATHTTCDPCSLLQEKILEWFKNGNWQEIVAEKRSVLSSMQQVLQSCHALLDSTQVPVNSIIKLLQHILRPYGAEQQMLASSRVGSSSATAGPAPPANGTAALQLPTAQLHHAAIGELLRLLRPASGDMPPAAAAAHCSAPAAAAAGASDADLAPLPLSVEKPWDPQEPAAAAAAAPKAAAGAGARGKGRGRGRAAAAAAAKKRERSRREQFMDVESFWRSCSPEQRLQLLQVPLAPLLEGVKQESGSEAAEELMEGLVLLREQANTSARYWLCTACDRKFHTANDFSAHLEACHEQLVLAKQPQQQLPGTGVGALEVPGSLPALPQDSLQQQLQQQGGSSLSAPLAYVSCSKCQAEVVGMYFSSIPQPNQQQQLQQHQLCLKCYRQVSASVGAATAEQAYSRVAPHSPALGCAAWSESGSEFISTRDSFSSCDGEDEDDVIDEDELDSQIGQLASSHMLGRGPLGPVRGVVPTKGQLTAQQQRQLAWLSAAVSRGASSSSAAATASGVPAALDQQQQQEAVAAARAPAATGAAAAPATTAPGMFVFGSKSSSASNAAPAVAAPGSLSSTLAAQSAAAAGGLPGALPAFSGARAAAAAQAPAGPAAAAARTAHGGTDTLSYELIAELEAVHAARKGFLQGQPAAAAAGLALQLQGAVAGVAADGSLPPSGQQQQQQSSQAQEQGSSSSTVNSSSSQSDSADSPAGASAGAGAMPVLPPLGTRRRSLESAATYTAGLGSSSAADGAAADMGTPTASGRTWRDWLLPKKLLQWSEGEEGQDEPGSGNHRDDPSFLGQQGSDDQALHDQLGISAAGAAVRTAGGAGPSLPRRYSDSSAMAGSSSSQQRQGKRTGSHLASLGPDSQAAGDAGTRGPSSSAPCSPRTPAAKDSRQGQEDAADGLLQPAATAAAASAGLELDSDSAGEQDADLSELPRHLIVPGVPGVAAAAAAAARPGAGVSLGPAGAVQLPGGSSKAAGGGAGALRAAASNGIGSSSALQQVDACMAAAGGEVLVDEIIRCMAQVYAADKDVADMTLGCLVDFVRRKLVVPAAAAAAGQPAGQPAAAASGAGGEVAAAGGAGSSSSSSAESDSAYFSSGSSKDSSPAAATSGRASGSTTAAAGSSTSQQQQLVVPGAVLLPPAEMQLVQQFLASPEAAYLSPEMMYATLCCLPASDLQMALAYVVRQHEDTLTQPGQSDSEADTASQSVLPEDDAGCMPLFQLHHLDELSFEQLVEHIWPGELEEPGVSGTVSGTAAAAGTSGKAAGAGAAGSAAGKAVSRAGSGPLLGQHLRPKHLQGAALDQAGSAAGASCAAADAGKLDQPKLLPSSWWLEHLHASSKAADPPAAAVGDQRVLRWVYGNIVSSQAEEFAANQAALRCNLDRQSALLELYEGMANAWRRMQRVADKRRVLEQLRQNIKTQFAVVRSQEDAGEHCTGQQAVTFLEALFTSLCTNSSSNTAAASKGSSGSSTVPVVTDGQPPAGDAAVAAGPAATASWPGSVSLSAPPALCLTAPPPGASLLQLEPPGLAGQGPDSQAGGPDSQAGTQQVLNALPAPAGSAATGSTAATATGAAAGSAMATVAAQNAAVSQLQVRLNQLAPLYLCEPAVEVVRSAPALAREASQRYARALLERELSVLALIEAMLEDDVAAARQKLAGANERLLARRTELSTAEAESARLTAEGPGSHRKKDFLDKATKEAEHREKLADLKAKIDAAKAAITEDEVTAAAADLAAADAQGDLTRVREQVRQIAARKKNLEDLNAQLSAPVPPLTAAALAAAATSGGAGAAPPLGVLPAAATTAALGRPCSCCPVPAVQQPAAAATTIADGSTSSTSTSSSSGGSGAAAANDGSSGSGAAAAANDGSSSSSSVGTDPAAISTAAELSWSWRAQRLECLMYRVLWVAEAVKLFQAQYEPRGKQYELLVRASKWVKERCDEYDLTFQAAAEDLSNLRNRVQQLACVDLTFDINEAALKYIRRRIEAEAATAQERRSQQLLLELAAEEEDAKKAAAAQQQAQQQQQGMAAAAAAQQMQASSDSSAGASGAAAGKGAKGKKGKDKQGAAARDSQQKQQKKQSEQEKKVQEDAARQALEAAKAARDAALEAELEQRRRELELLEAQREAEHIKQAQEASLKEQQALKRAQEASLREQQALADAAAVLAAAAGSGDMSLLNSGSSSSSSGAQSGAGGKGQQAAGKAAKQASSKASPGAAAGSGPAGAQAAAQRNRSGQQLQQSAPPAAANKAPAKAAAPSNRAAAATANGSVSPATPGKAGKAAVPAAAPAAAAAASKQQQRNLQQQQQPARSAAQPVSSASAGAAAQGRKVGKAGPGGHPAAAGAPGVHAALAKQHQQQQQQQHEHRHAATHAQQQQEQEEATPSLLDFGPTPAEAYAAAAAKEQHQAAAAGAAPAGAGAAMEQQQHALLPPPPPPPPRRPPGAAATAGNVAPAAAASAAVRAATPSAAAGADAAPPAARAPAALAERAPAAAAAAAPAAAAAGPGLSTRDEVVHMPASGAGSSSHLFQLSLSHLDEAAAGPPVSIANTSSTGFGGLGLGRSGGAMSLPLSTSLRGSTSSPMIPLVPAGSAGSSFDPFGSSYGPPDALLLQPAAAAGGAAATASLGSRHPQQQQGRPAGLQLQSASSAPVNAELGISSLGAPGQSGAGAAAGHRPSLDLATATRAGSGSSTGSSSRHVLPPRPSTACSNLLMQHAPGTAGAGDAAAAAAAAAGFASEALGGSVVSRTAAGGSARAGGVEPGSPLLMGSSPADAPHIQSIMSLLDGDTGLRSSQQQQQSSSRPSTSGSSEGPAQGRQQQGMVAAAAAAVAAAAGGAGGFMAHGGRGRPGSAGAADAAGGQQQQQRLAHHHAAGRSWDGAAAGGPKRSSGAGIGNSAAAVPGAAAGAGPRRSSDAAHQPGSQALMSPPGLTAVQVQAAAGSGAAAAARGPVGLQGAPAGFEGTPRPSSASSSTSADAAAGLPRQQQQQQNAQAWLMQQQQQQQLAGAGFGGGMWGAVGGLGGSDGSWGSAAAGGVAQQRGQAGFNAPAASAGWPTQLVQAPGAGPGAVGGVRGAGDRRDPGPTGLNKPQGTLQGSSAAAQYTSPRAVTSNVAAAANGLRPVGVSPSASPVPVGAAMGQAGGPVMRGGSPAYQQTQHVNAANLAAAAAAAATAAVNKARQQQQQQMVDPLASAAAAAAMAYGEAGLGLYSAAPAGVGGGFGGGSRTVLGHVPGGVAGGPIVSSGLGMYAGGLGTGVTPGGFVSIGPGAIGGMDGRAAMLGHAAGGLAGIGGGGAVGGMGVVGGQAGLWGWQQGVHQQQQQQAAAVAMAAAMQHQHQQQQQQAALAGRAGPAGMQGLWQQLQPTQQQQQQQQLGRGQQQLGR